MSIQSRPSTARSRNKFHSSSCAPAEFRPVHFFCIHGPALEKDGKRARSSCQIPRRPSHEFPIRPLRSQSTQKSTTGRARLPMAKHNASENVSLVFGSHHSRLAEAPKLILRRRWASAARPRPERRQKNSSVRERSQKSWPSTTFAEQTGQRAIRSHDSLNQRLHRPSSRHWDLPLELRLELLLEPANLPRWQLAKSQEPRRGSFASLSTDTTRVERALWASPSQSA